MKKQPDYKRDCLRSAYFDPNAKESLMAVNERWNNPFKMPTLYRHMQMHQKRDISRSERLAKLDGTPSKVWQRNTIKQVEKREDNPVTEIIETTEKLLETSKLPSQTHELVLDKFITIGEDRLAHNEIPITATNLLKAIEIKAKIEQTTKDRKLDMLRSMFTGAAPKKEGEDGKRLQDTSGFQS